MGNIILGNMGMNLITENKGPLLIELMMDGATECRPRLAFGAKLDEQLPHMKRFVGTTAQ